MAQQPQMPNPNSMPDPTPSTSKEIEAQQVPALLQPPLKQTLTRRDAIRRAVRPRKVNQTKSKNPLPAKRRKKTDITTEDSDSDHPSDEDDGGQILKRRGRPRRTAPLREEPPLHRSPAANRSNRDTQENAQLWNNAAGLQAVSAAVPNASFMIKAMMPNFNKDAPKTWFIRLEGFMSAYSLPEADKYFTLTSLIPTDLDTKLQHSWTSIENLPMKERYDALKQCLISCTTVTTAERSFRLMTLPFLGQKLPSELMIELLKLTDPPGTFTTDNLHLFLSRLPYDLSRAHTDKTADGVPNPMAFALKMDRELEVLRSRWRHKNSIPGQSRGSSSAVPQHTAKSHNSAQHRQGSQHSWQGSTTRANAKPHQGNTTSSKRSSICSYHQRFGAAARTCANGCQWNTLNVIQQAEDDPQAPTADLYISDDEYFPEQGKHNVVQCKITQLDFFIDTGASISFIPVTTSDKLNVGLLEDSIKFVQIADGSLMPVKGYVNMTIDLGLGRMTWKFYVAKVAFPILGRDFLIHYDVLVDSRRTRLVRLSNGMAVIPTITTISSDKSLASIMAQVGLPDNFSIFKSTFGDVEGASLKNFKVQATQHYIRTSGPPCTSKVRRISPEKMEALRDYIEDMLRQNVIRPSSSPWSSPLQIAKKKDLTWRICGDYRLLNLQTQKDMYPVPNILDVQNILHNRKIFSKIDLAKGYWQIPMAKEDMQKTAIVTPLGLYEFTRMPFGLSNSSQTFQRTMDTIFRGDTEVFLYVDDILIASKSEADHVKALHRVFKTLQSNGLGIALKKCSFFKENLTFLGFNIDQTGASPPEDRVKALLDIPMPTTPKGMQKFLGAVNFFRRFFKGFAGPAIPLYSAAKLPNPHKARQWDASVTEAFQTIKQIIADRTILYHPDPSATIAVTTDASDTAMGATLEQFKDKEWQPLAFFSRAWKPPQKKYAAYDKELIAVVEAIKHFRYYLEGAKFTVYTDHLPLVSGFRKRTIPISTMQQRHFAFISEYTDDLRHLPGKQNVLADLLSRAIMTIHTNVPVSLLQRIRQLQAQDPEMRALQEKYPSRFKVEQVGEIDLVGDVSRSFRIFVPEALRAEVFQLIHGLSHPGARQTKLDIAKTFIWTHMDKSIKAMVQACIACQKAKTFRHDKRPLQHFELPSQRFEHLHIDLVGPLPPSRGNIRHLLTIVDRYSRFPMAIPIKSPKAGPMIHMLCDRWISLFGLPKRITTDNGAIFSSGKFLSFLKAHSIEWKPTTSYHPQANGMVERLHRRLKESLTASGRQWLDQLPWTLLSIRNAKGPDIPYSPAEAVFGSAVRQPLTLTQGEETMPLKDFCEKRVQMVPPPPYQGRWHVRQKPARPTRLAEVSYVLIKRASKSPLQFSYAGPFPLIRFDEKTATINYQGQPYTVTRDRVKPMFSDSNKYYFKPPDDHNLG